MSINIRIFSDYIWPFCYVGKGIVDELKKDFDIKDEWLGFEIHPETPSEGVLLSEKLPQIDWIELYRNLRQTGAQFGIVFGEVTLLSNSRMALEASEFARDHGQYDRFHAGLFRSYFTEVQDIGQMEVIMKLAGKLGLDTDDLKIALKEKCYAKRLEGVNQEARQYGITAAPTFVINGKDSVVGAQPIEFFRETLKKNHSRGLW